MKKASLITVLVFLCIQLSAQTDLKKPEASQAATVMQRIGLTDITITYHSPLAKGRKIWGDLVPFNEVWRAGANENTTISFTTDVKVEGKVLKAGTYGLHMIPSEKEWIVIFSNDALAWGSFFYNEKHDALRITVNPKIVENQDWLSYSFLRPQADNVIAELRWEKLAIPFTIFVDVHEIVIQNLRNELTGINGFFWQGFNQAANYCISNNVHLEDAGVWINRSIEIQKTFLNLNTKSKLLLIQGKPNEAEALKKESISFADENQLNTYGYELLGQNKNQDALAVFKSIVVKYPKSWNAYDSYAEALEKSGDKKNAISNYKIAFAKSPETQKARIKATIEKLEK